MLSRSRSINDGTPHAASERTCSGTKWLNVKSFPDGRLLPSDFATRLRFPRCHALRRPLTPIVSRKEIIEHGT